MMPRVPPTSAVSPQPTRPLSVVILTSSAVRYGDVAVDGPNERASLWLSENVSTAVIVSELGFSPGSGSAFATPASAAAPANAPPLAAKDDRNQSRREIPVLYIQASFKLCEMDRMRDSAPAGSANALRFTLSDRHDTQDHRRPKRDQAFGRIFLAGCPPAAR